MEESASDERILALAEPYLCGGEQPVMHARVVREQAMRALLSPPSAASSPALGQLIITNFAVLFVVERSSGPSSSSGSQERSTDELWWNSLDIKVPLGAISRVESKKDKFVRIHCKDIRMLQFTMPFTLADPTNTKKQMEMTLRKIESTICMFAFSGRLKNLFAFSHSLSIKNSVDGWERANVRRDLQRMGLPTEKWRISEANHSYLICPTYPSVFAVPSNVSDITLHKVSAFRSKGRIPILSWVHPRNEATITRAAQPLVGIGGSRSTEDEHLIKEIIRANPSSALVIMDARPKVNAAANKARGAGYETMSHYAGEISGTSEEIIASVAEVEGLEGGVGQSGALEFLGIDNIHVMRDSEKKLKEVCQHLATQDKGWLTALDHTRWLDYVSLLLACTRRMVLTIEAGISIFTHCSDGWDRTSQLSALAMLCLDPYYRTIEGFATLIEREWLSVGHKFHQRYGHGDKHYDDSNRSPIFPQFIDCVYQLLQQFPTCFEFNEAFLVTVLDGLYSCQYGTFLCNSEKERYEAQLYTKTVSLWSYTEKHKDRFTSRVYIPYAQVLLPQSLAKHLKFWSLYHLRFCRFNEHNPDRWCRDQLPGHTSDKQQQHRSKKEKARKRKEKREEKGKASHEDRDLLQHLAERERWKRDLASREAEVKRMKKMAEKHMEVSLRLRSRLAYERKRAAFFLERLDRVTHQGSEHLECEWEAEWKRRRETLAEEDEEDEEDEDDDEDEDDGDTSTQNAANKERRKEQEPDELVEFFIRSPSKPRLPSSSSSSSSSSSASGVVVPKLPPLPQALDGSTTNPPPIPSPPSRRPPPPPPAGGLPSPRSAPGPSAPSPSHSPLPSPSVKPPPVRSPPFPEPSGANPLAPSPRSALAPLAKALSPTTGMSPRGGGQTIPSHQSGATGDPSARPVEGKLSIHRQMGKKLIPFLMRRPTREELVSRRILLPAEEDILLALEGSHQRGSVDEPSASNSSPSTSHRADDSDDESSSASPAGEVDDLIETDRAFLLRAASAAAAAGGGGGDVSPRQPPLSAPAPLGNGGEQQSGNSGSNSGSLGGAGGRSFLSSSTSSSGSSWMASQTMRGKTSAPQPAHVPFTPAHHRNGGGAAPPGQQQQQPEPKRGLVQRFVSEKNIISSSLKNPKPGSRP